MLNFRAKFAHIKTQIGTKIKIWLATMFGEAVVSLSSRTEIFQILLNFVYFHGDAPKSVFFLLYCFWKSFFFRVFSLKYIKIACSIMRWPRLFEVRFRSFACNLRGNVRSTVHGRNYQWWRSFPASLVKNGSLHTPSKYWKNLQYPPPKKIRNKNFYRVSSEYS